MEHSQPVALVALVTVVWSVATLCAAWLVARKRGLDLGLNLIVGVVVLALLGAGAYAISPEPRSLATDLACIGIGMALWTDIRWKVMLDATTYSTFVITLLALAPALRDPGALASTGLGIAIVAGFFGLLFLLSSGSAIGLGDVKIGLSIGAALGLALAPSFVVFTAALTVVVGTILVLRGRRGEIIFGPFIAVGMALTVGFGAYVARFFGG